MQASAAMARGIRARANCQPSSGRRSAPPAPLLQAARNLPASVRRRSGKRFVFHRFSLDGAGRATAVGSFFRACAQAGRSGRVLMILL